MPIYKPNCQGVGKGWSQHKTHYYAMYYEMYKHRYKYRYLEKKNKVEPNLDYKKLLIECGFLKII